MSREPIAIVGMACRLPGAPDLAALWSLLVEGRVGLRPVPLERYDVDRPDGADRRGRPLPREGGFLDDVTDFDHGLFRLSAREAMSMDPQHRLLLEVAWSALQDAGLSREAVYGARAAVYVGLFTSDFRERMLRAKELDLDVYFEIGTTRSSAAGRISHAFHLQGPAGAVDAACASSLLSVHLAAQSLWSGESSLALAGGSNLLLEADTTICFHRSGMLSPRSRCHFGDADADGFVRSEGVGMVVLKRLSDALRDGDRVYAVIPSTAATNDGRSGDGLFMTPSVEGQELLLRQAYVEAGLDLRRVAFIEAHGTGTRAGDPVECTAIARVLGAGRDRPLPLGSIKTNIGHCEGAAGIAGLLKAALALHHRSLPGSLHLRSFNPDIPWEAGQLQIPQVATPLPAGPLLAGVNSFGLSGTDVHVVLGTAPERPIAEPPGPPVGGWVLPLSAHSPAALRALAERVGAAAVASSPAALWGLAATLGHRRSRLSRRGALFGDTGGSFAQSLAELQIPGEDEAPFEGERRLVWICSGHGGQWAQMGEHALMSDPTFAAALADFDGHTRRIAGWSPLEALADPEAAWTRRMDRVQPLICAFQWALGAWWAAQGQVPDAIVGHSMGEVAAAALAGVIDLPDAVSIICARSSLMASRAGQGAMAVVPLDAPEAERAVAGWPGLEVAVHNAPGSVVVAGAADRLAAFLEEMAAAGLLCRPVDVDVASHSPQMEPLVGPLIAQLGHLQPRAPGQGPLGPRLWSSVDAAPVTGASWGASYWGRNLRSRVRYAETIAALVQAGADTFVELSPHPVLLRPTQLIASGRGGLVVPSMHREDRAGRSLGQGRAALWGHGLLALPPALGAPVVSGPDYPFQRERCWPTAGLGAVPAAPVERAAAPGHPLLGQLRLLGVETPSYSFEAPIGLVEQPWTVDHQVRGSVLFPGAGFVEAARAAAQQTLGGGPIRLEDVELMDYLQLRPEQPTPLSVVCSPGQGGRLRVEVASAAEGGARRLHARAWAVGAPPVGELTPPPTLDPGAPEADGTHPWAQSRRALGEALHEAMTRLGLRTRGAVGLLLLRLGSPDRVVAARAHLRPLLEPGLDLWPLGASLVVLQPELHDPAHLMSVAGRVRALLVGAGLLPAASPIGGRAVLRPEPVDALVERLAGAGLPGLPLDDPEDGGHELDPEAFYGAMAERGIHYGPRFRPVTLVRWRGQAALAELWLPAELLGELGRYGLHPAALDGCFQAALAPFLVGGQDGGWHGFLPVGVHRVHQHGPLTERCRVRAWFGGERGEDGSELLADFFVEDDAGRVVLMVVGLAVKRFRAVEQVAARPDDCLWRWRWEPEAAAPARRAVPQRLLIVESGEAAGAALEAEAMRRGHRVWRRALADLDEKALRGMPPASSVVLLIGPSAALSTRADPTVGLEAAASLGASVVEALRRLVGAWREAPPLWICTQGGAQVRAAERPVPALGALWGLVRVARREWPDQRLQLCDLSARPTADELEGLLEGLRAELVEDERALRGPGRFVHRLRAEPGPAADPVAHTALPGQQLIIDLGSGALSAGAAPEGEGALVELLAVSSAPGWSAGVGRVRALPAGVGADPRDVRVGDSVLTVFFDESAEGAGPARLARLHRLPVAGLLRVEGSIDPVRGTSQLRLGLVAALLVEQLGREPEGQRVCVRLAGDALGEAIVGALLSAGARVSATAADADGRARLRRIGANPVLDEAHPALERALLELTGGLDLMVCPEGGAAGPAEGALVRGGRVLELGPGAVSRLPAGASVVRLDVAASLARHPARLRVRLSFARALGLSLGAPALPVFLPGATPPAGHGPAVWAISGPVSLQRPPTLSDRLDPQASYLITGGLGALGLSVAETLAEAGARHLVLLSRGGRASADGDRRIGALRDRGAAVVIAAADVADRDRMQEVFARFGAEWPALDGVFHLAGLLDDATLAGQDLPRFERVLRPKLGGALCLHQLSLDRSLRHFVLFSSAAGALGSPGQASYAAANAALDTLAEARRASGLPGVALQWGVWSEAGLAAAEANRGERLAERGLIGMPDLLGLGLLRRCLIREDEPVVGVFAIDWERWGRAFPGVARQPSVAHLLPRVEAASVCRPLDTLREAGPEARRPLLFGLLQQTVAAVLRVPPGRVGARKPLAELGLDSLMTVELHGRLRDLLEVDLPPGRILALGHLDALTDGLLRAVEVELAGAPQADAVEVETARVLQLARTGPVATLTAPREEVLITGANGFLGAHLVRELLDHPSGGRLRCLVRGSDPAAAALRLQEAMEALGLWRPGDEAQIDVICGDLASPNLGLDEATWRALSMEVGAVFHCGAQVNHLLPYEALSATNVDGTAEVLRLAAAGRRAVVHHISTIGVFDFTGAGPAGLVVDEDSPPTADSEPFFGGYAATKRMAELLCIQARDRGLDVRIYRLGLITGSAGLGASPHTDALWRMVQAVVAMGAAPQLRQGLCLSPVDGVARGLRVLGALPEADGANFHLLSDRETTVVDLQAALAAIDLPIALIDAAAWTRGLLETADRNLSVTPLLPRLGALDLGALDAAPSVLARGRTLALLSPADRASLQVGDGLLVRYLVYLQRVGLLPDLSATTRVASVARR